MKNERRHELKTNDLARNAEGFPAFLNKYGNRILFGMLVVMLVVILVIRRNNAAAERTLRAGQNLALARNEIMQLTQMSPNAGETRDFLYHDIVGRLDLVTPDVTDSPAMAAQALLDKGDADWAFSNALVASTQPSTVTQSSPSELLDSSADAYGQVISKYADQTESVDAAYLGLGAIAENQKDWGKARTQYQAVLNNSDSSSTFKAYAQNRLQNLDQLEQPVYLAQVNSATTQATTSPSLNPLLSTMMPDLSTPATTLPSFSATTLPTDLLPTTSPALPSMDLNLGPSPIAPLPSGSTPAGETPGGSTSPLPFNIPATQPMR